MKAQQQKTKCIKITTIETDFINPLASVPRRNRVHHPAPRILRSSMHDHRFGLISLEESEKSTIKLSNNILCDPLIKQEIQNKKGDIVNIDLKTLNNMSPYQLYKINQKYQQSLKTLQFVRNYKQFGEEKEENILEKTYIKKNKKEIKIYEIQPNFQNLQSNEEKRHYSSAKSVRKIRNGNNLLRKTFVQSQKSKQKRKNLSKTIVFQRNYLANAKKKEFILSRNHQNQLIKATQSRLASYHRNKLQNKTQNGRFSPQLELQKYSPFSNSFLKKQFNLKSTIETNWNDIKKEEGA